MPRVLCKAATARLARYHCCIFLRHVSAVHPKHHRPLGRPSPRGPCSAKSAIQKSSSISEIQVKLNRPPLKPFPKCDSSARTHYNRNPPCMQPRTSTSVPPPP